MGKEIQCDNPQQFTFEDVANIEELKKASLLVLCKSELFFQGSDGKEIDTFYPVGREAAILISACLQVPLMSS